MEENVRMQILNTEFSEALRRLVCSNGELDISTVKDRGWLIHEIDDKALVDEDADRIGRAFLSTGSDHFLVLCIETLLSQRNAIRVYAFPSSKEGVEAFQGEEWYELNLYDCLMFTPSLKGVVFRPGEVASSFIVGEDSFVRTASGDSATT